MKQLPFTRRDRRHRTGVSFGGRSGALDATCMARRSLHLYAVREWLRLHRPRLSGRSSGVVSGQPESVDCP